jgi:hypothetical protein
VLYRTNYPVENQNADISELEKEIDKLVYELYELSTEETALIDRI